jgi:hypothetical protein
MMRIKGKPHSLVVLRVLEWDEKGRPSKCVIGYDDTTFRIDDETPNEFFTVLVPVGMTETKRRDN